MYIDSGPSGMRWPENLTYFGNPGSEEDENWHSLIHNRYWMISEDEAKRAWGKDYKQYEIDPDAKLYIAG
jgi:hypothetical protein